METSRDRLTVDLSNDPGLKEHLEKVAKAKGVDLSKYVRAALKKVSGFKEKPIV